MARGRGQHEALPAAMTMPPAGQEAGNARRMAQSKQGRPSRRP